MSSLSGALFSDDKDSFCNIGHLFQMDASGFLRSCVTVSHCELFKFCVQQLNVPMLPRVQNVALASPNT